MALYGIGLKANYIHIGVDSKMLAIFLVGA
jgi:hypothetical protein